MAYTCAYYPSAAATLEQAQTAKMDHVCRKLRLGAGDSVVEAGCGWGSLALHMARRYGAKVRAFNISREQLDFARRRARDEGLEDRVEFVEDDYRNISGTYDAFASVGMLEHVGREHYPDLGRVIRNVLTKSGRALVHSHRPQPAGIAAPLDRAANLPRCLRALAQRNDADLRALQFVGARRREPAAALRADAAPLAGAFRSQIGPRCAPCSTSASCACGACIWPGRSQHSDTGTLQLFQVLVAPYNNHDLPLTRDYLYSR